MAWYQDPNDPYGTGTETDPTVPPEWPPNPSPSPAPNPTPTPTPSPSPTPTPSPTPAPSPTPYSDAAFQAIMRKYPPTAEGRQQAIQEANTTFGTSMSLFGTKLDKVRLPDGRTIDVIIGAGTGNPQWGWQDTATSTGTSGGPVDLSQIAVDPSYLTPYAGSAPRGTDVNFVAPSPFQAPTAQSILDDPSYQLRRDEGAGVLQNSAAAKGTLNSGGTLYDLLNYGQRAASQEYGNIWDRQFGVWNANWNNALTSFRSNKDTADTSYGRAWQSYLDAKNDFYSRQDRAFQKLYSLASLGAGTAGA